MTLERPLALVLAAAGVVVLVALLLLFFLGDLLRALHVAFVTFISLPVGALVLLLVQRAVGAPYPLRLVEALRSIARTMPLFFVLALPLVLGLDAVFPWARPDYVAAHEAVAHKEAYLNGPFFITRLVIILTLWSLLAHLAVREGRGGRRLGVVGLIVFAPTATFASFDWWLSIDPLFNSSITPLVFVTSAGLAAFSLAIGLGFKQALEGGPHEDWGSPVLGRFLLGGLILWAYLVYIEFLTIWSGNLPQHAEWYLLRSGGFWSWIIWLIALTGLAVPFFLLLLSHLRKRWDALVVLAGLVLAGQIMHLVWRVAPGWGERSPNILLLIATLGAVGFIWFEALRRLRGDRPMLRALAGPADVQHSS